ncbi:MAG: hypothetical protein C0490_11295 [Marivirga sp.]|nr:hypothetical protein [Marivirga sp.]
MNILLKTCKKNGLHTYQSVSEHRCTSQPICDDEIARCKNRIFIHLMCAKEYSYFNAILIKARHDLKEEIADYQNVLDPDSWG